MKIYLKLKNSLCFRIFRLFYKYKCKSFGNKSVILPPLKIDGIENISIGNNVYIAYKTWLAAMPLTGGKSVN